MRSAPCGPILPDRIDLAGKRLLIFVVAYNAETTIEKVLSRIPASLHQPSVEVLIIDDSSTDDTFLNGLRYQQAHSALKITVLRTQENQAGFPLRHRDHCSARPKKAPNRRTSDPNLLRPRNLPCERAKICRGYFRDNATGASPADESLFRSQVRPRSAGRNLRSETRL